MAQVRGMFKELLRQQQRKLWLARLGLWSAAGVLLVVGLAALAVGLFGGRLVTGLGMAAVTIGAAAMLAAAGLVLGVIVQIAQDMARDVNQTSRLMGQLVDESAETLEQLTEMTERLKALERWTAIPPAGSEILAVPLERSAFKLAIDRAWQNEDWAEANRLIDGFASRFDGDPEAARLRLRTEQLQHSAVDRRARDQIAKVRALIDADRFFDAERELMSFREAFPKDTRADNLATTLRRARRRRREALARQWSEACEGLDVDALHRLLEAFKELAGDDEIGEMEGQIESVDRAAQLQLRERFMEHYRAKRWAAAIEAGEQIVKRYPHTRMAQDFDQKLRAELTQRMDHALKEARQRPPETEPVSAPTGRQVNAPDKPDG